MSEQPHEPPDGQDPTDDLAVPDAPLDERPPVAGGRDDGPPAQGDGAPDSW